MIIVHLKGGLGNQLFQYAAGLSLAKHHKVPVKVDLTELGQPDEEIGTIRNYELKNLINPPIIATKQEIAALTNQNVFQKYFYKFFPSYKRIIYNEKKFEFDKNFFQCGKDLFLKGYRQSEKYFVSIEKDIRAEFQLKEHLIKEVQIFSERLKTTNSVAIHIRRGDYTNAAIADYHGILSEDYYQNSINKISSIISNPTFYIFSDNISWVKDTLRFEKPVEFVSGTISKNHYEDFYLMSKCKHNIVANSSFSWWAAWLNNNPNKIVLAPKRWFNTTGINTIDLIPDNWIQM